MSDNAVGYWLRSWLVDCSQCGERLYCLDRSPFHDEYLLYCDQCASRVEVSYYDPMVMSIDKEVRIEDGRRHAILLSEIERRLRPCECGGRFRYNAARRCHSCGGVISDEPGVDVWPSVYGVDPDEVEITDEMVAQVTEFENRHIRRDNHWR